MNIIFLIIFSMIGCYHDISQDSGDTAQLKTASSGGSNTIYCYVEEPNEEE